VRIWLASFPRSGNTFFRVLLNTLHGITSDAIYPGEWEGFNRRWPGRLPPSDMVLSDSSRSAVRFTKTHELPDADDVTPAIYLVRDGRDAYVSYANFVLAADPRAPLGRSYEEVLRALVASRDHFGGWSYHVDAWTRRARVAVVRFEELVVEPAPTVARACAQLQLRLPMSPSGFVPTFSELKAWKPESFDKGNIESWRTEMTTEIEALFWDLHGTTMTQLGYRREGWTARAQTIEKRRLPAIRPVPDMRGRDFGSCG
jgi:Sulfotransferase domain